MNDLDFLLDILDRLHCDSKLKSLVRLFLVERAELCNNISIIKYHDYICLANKNNDNKRIYFKIAPVNSENRRYSYKKNDYIIIVYDQDHREVWFNDLNKDFFAFVDTNFR